MWRQLSMKDDVHRLTEVRALKYVSDSPTNNSTGNLAVSLRTEPGSPWKVIERGVDPKRPSTMTREDCKALKWPGCDGSVHYITSGNESTMSLFVVRFQINKDDLVTFSGEFRSNCLHLAVYLSGDTEAGWADVPMTLHDGTKLDSLDNAGPSGLGEATSSSSLHYSVPSQAGVHFIGLALTTESPVEIGFWFDGVVSGTLAENIMAV